MTNQSSRKEIESALVDAVQAGFAAEDIAKNVLEPIRSRRAAIHALLESDGLMVSGIVIDRGVVNMPHLILESLRTELKVLRSMEDSFVTAIQRGQEAQNELRKMEQEKQESTQANRLRF